MAGVKVRLRATVKKGMVYTRILKKGGTGGAIVGHGEILGE